MARSSSSDVGEVHFFHSEIFCFSSVVTSSLGKGHFRLCSDSKEIPIQPGQCWSGILSYLVFCSENIWNHGSSALEYFCSFSCILPILSNDWSSLQCCILVETPLRISGRVVQECSVTGRQEGNGKLKRWPTKMLYILRSVQRPVRWFIFAGMFSSWCKGLFKWYMNL